MAVPQLYIKNVLIPPTPAQGATDGTIPTGYEMVMTMDAPYRNDEPHDGWWQCLLFGPVDEVHNWPYHNSMGVTRDAVVSLSNMTFNARLYGKNVDDGDMSFCFPVYLKLEAARRFDPTDTKLLLWEYLTQINGTTPVEYKFPDYPNIYLPKDWNIFITVMCRIDDDSDAPTMTDMFWRFQCLIRLDD